jgi:hypothetical protein
MSDESKGDAVRLAQVLDKELDGKPEMSVYFNPVGKYLCIVPIALLVVLFDFLLLYALHMLFGVLTACFNAS